MERAEQYATSWTPKGQKKAEERGRRREGKEGEEGGRRSQMMMQRRREVREKEQRESRIPKSELNSMPKLTQRKGSRERGEEE